MKTKLTLYLTQRYICCAVEFFFSPKHLPRLILHGFAGMFVLCENYELLLTQLQSIEIVECCSQTICSKFRGENVIHSTVELANLLQSDMCNEVAETRECASFWPNTAQH